MTKRKHRRSVRWVKFWHEAERDGDYDDSLELMLGTRFARLMVGHETGRATAPPHSRSSIKLSPQEAEKLGEALLEWAAELDAP